MDLPVSEEEEKSLSQTKGNVLSEVRPGTTALGSSYSLFNSPSPKSWTGVWVFFLLRETDRETMGEGISLIKET